MPVAGGSLNEDFFEMGEEPLGGGRADGLPLMLASLAHLARTAGIPVVIAAEDTERDVEVKLESKILDSRVSAYSSAAIPDAENHYSYMLSEAGDLEQHWLSKQNFTELTKMALARQIQIQDDLTDEARNKLWHLNRAALMLAWSPTAGIQGTATEHTTLHVVPMLNVSSRQLLPLGHFSVGLRDDIDHNEGPKHMGFNVRACKLT